MPTYKLMYFDTKGRAEVVRLAFAAAGQTFEDKRISKEEWPAIKPTVPQNQLPCLQVDDRIIPQSGAIMRYVAREFGLYGDGNDENTQVDVILGTAEDFLKHAIAIFLEKDEAQKAELVKDVEETKLPQFLNLLEGILKENGGGDGYFVGKKISLADLLIFDISDQIPFLVKFPPFPPKLGELINKVKNYPGIKEYIAKRGN